MKQVLYNNKLLVSPIYLSPLQVLMQYTIKPLYMYMYFIIVELTHTYNNFRDMGMELAPLHLQYSSKRLKV